MQLASLIATILGILSTLVGGIALIASYAKKRYAAERDFQHLKNNYMQLSSNLSNYRDDIDEKLDRIIDEIKDLSTEVKLSRIALSKAKPPNSETG